MFEGQEQLPLPTKDYILSKISEYQIYKFYFPEYEPFTGSTCSPLRKDNNPSFSIFLARTGKLIWHDYAEKESGDCFKFVEKKFNLDFKGSLNKICIDFGIKGVHTYLMERTIQKIPKDKKLTSKPRARIEVQIKDYSESELIYWATQGISLHTLRKYHIYSLSACWINGLCIRIPYMFGFLENKDNVLTWKIYMPFHKQKWYSNVDESVIQGFSQLPVNGNILIITKSLKDVCAIVENTNFHSCAPQAEGQFIKPRVLTDLLLRFQKVFILWDNDKPGKKFSAKFSQTYNLPAIFVPEQENIKDFTDLIFHQGLIFATNYLNNTINDKIQNSTGYW